MRKALVLAFALVLGMTSGVMAQSMAGSYVNPISPTMICPFTQYTFQFEVWNGSPDTEWCDVVDITFPPGFGIIAGTEGFIPGWSAPWSFAFQILGQTAEWYDNDGGYGEIYDADGGTFYVDATTGDMTGGTNFDWHLSGDDWGSEPHEVYGSFSIPAGPSATEMTTWGAVKGLYR